MASHCLARAPPPTSPVATHFECFLNLVVPFVQSSVYRLEIITNEIGPISPVTQISVVGLLRFLHSGNLNPPRCRKNKAMATRSSAPAQVCVSSTRAGSGQCQRPRPRPHLEPAPRPRLELRHRHCHILRTHPEPLSHHFMPSPVSTTSTSTSTSTAIIAMLDMPRIAEILMEKEKQQKRASTSSGARGAKQDSDDGRRDPVTLHLWSSVSEIKPWTLSSPSSEQDLGQTEVDQDEGAKASRSGPLAWQRLHSPHSFPPLHEGTVQWWGVGGAAGMIKAELERVVLCSAEAQSKQLRREKEEEWECPYDDDKIAASAVVATDPPPARHLRAQRPDLRVLQRRSIQHPQPGHGAALRPGAFSSLVVGVGESQMDIVPIYDGLPLPSARGPRQRARVPPSAPAEHPAALGPLPHKDGDEGAAAVLIAVEREGVIESGMKRRATTKGQCR
ncbi:hypothetical protein BC826DRAFT_1110447 [Russula brevipes]|nr:hypothetical protein BC826DRAFT_1110447 [Russula brevipes]